MHGLLSVTWRCPLLGMSVIRGSTVMFNLDPSKMVQGLLIYQHPLDKFGPTPIKRPQLLEHDPMTTCTEKRAPDYLTVHSVN